MSAAFVNTLFTQTVAFAAEEFNISHSGQGTGAAIVRFGIVICIPLVALADRRGRRPLIIAVAWAAPCISALGAVAPTFGFLVATQAIGRPLGLTLDILIMVIAIEEMPRNSRAFATGFLAIISGVGAGVAVIALPLADTGVTAWRWIYVLSLLWIIVAIALTKWLPESERFIRHHSSFAQTRTHITSAVRKNLFRICAVVFLTNIFIATVSIFQNRYLKDERGYSGLLIALFTVATASPAFLGLLVGARIADVRGRRIIGATMVPVGAMSLALSFAFSGPAMWVTATIGTLAFGLSYPALAVYRGELFPTRLRGLAGGLIMAAALLGGSIGLIGAGQVLDRGMSYATVMMWLVIGPCVASLLVWKRYPETAHLELEEIVNEELEGSPPTQK